MKVKRERNGHYTGRIGPYLFHLFYFERRKKWDAVADLTKQTRYTVGTADTLEAIKAKCVRWWLRQRLAAIHAMVCDLKLSTGEFAEFHALHTGCCHLDTLAPMVLRDWLYDHSLGEKWEQNIVQPGLAAKVIWPHGWQPCQPAKQ